MKPLFLFLLTLLSTLYSCIDQTQVVKRSAVYQLKAPVIIDSLISSDYREQERYKWTSYFQPYYIGKYKDTVSLDGKSDYTRYVDSVGKGGYGWIKNSFLFGLYIIVDTSQTITIPEGITLRVIPPGEKPNNDPVTLYKGHPIFLVNCSFRNILGGVAEGDNNHLFMSCVEIVTEAKDTNGNWEPIETGFSTMCGTSLREIFIPPGDVLVTAFPIYKGGKFKTKLRLCYAPRSPYPIYSNEFEGYINLSQFQDPPRL